MSTANKHSQIRLLIKLFVCRSMGQPINTLGRLCSGQCLSARLKSKNSRINKRLLFGPRCPIFGLLKKARFNRVSFCLCLFGFGSLIFGASQVRHCVTVVCHFVALCLFAKILFNLCYYAKTL